MIKYKIDMKNALKDANFTYTDARKSKLISQTTYGNIVNGKTNITLQTLNILCLILDCLPQDIIEFIPDQSDRAIMDKL